MERNYLCELYKAGKYEEVVAHCDMMISKGDVCSTIFSVKGRALIELGQIPQALACFEHVSDQLEAEFVDEDPANISIDRLLCCDCYEEV